MNRRDLLKTAAIAAGASGISGAATPDRGPAKVVSEIMRINLRHTWTTTMSSSLYRDTIMVRYTRDGVTGHGEGAPIVRYNESAESAQRAAQSVRELLAAGDPWQFDKLLAQVSERVRGEYAGKAAIDRRVHAHGLRHTYAAELARERTPINVIRDALGHTTLSVTDRYLRDVAPIHVIDTMRARRWDGA